MIKFDRYFWKYFLRVTLFSIGMVAAAVTLACLILYGGRWFLLVVIIACAAWSAQELANSTRERDKRRDK